MRELYDGWDNPQALKWAYNAAGLSKEGRVQEWEFRAVLRHAVYFSNRWAQFQTVQDGGDDGNARLMSLKEFLLACAVVGVGVRKQDAVESFYDLDIAGAGYIPFDGFCAWCSRQQLSQSSSGKPLALVDRPRLPTACGNLLNWVRQHAPLPGREARARGRVVDYYY